MRISRQLGALAIWILSIEIVIPCFGQAWVPAKGEGEVSLVYQNLYTRDHLDQNGNVLDAGRVRLQGVIQAVDFGLTDKLAVTATMPLFTGKYDGAKPHQLPIDNGNYHGGAQDFRFNLRYSLTERHLNVTPFLGISLPTSNYEHFAHSAIGAGMWEVGMGVNAGRKLGPWLPNAYFQTRYTYVLTNHISIPEYNLDLRPNHHRFDGELGYFLTKRISLRAIAGAQLTPGGLDQSTTEFPLALRIPSDPKWRQHDRISRIDYVNMGAGIGIPITKTIDAYALYATKLWAVNGHALNDGISLGMSWSFHAPWAHKPTMYGASAGEKVHAKLNEMKLCH
jgi:hypothetical protein